MRYKIILLVMSLLSFVSVKAQTLDEAMTAYKNYTSMQGEGIVNERSYGLLLQAYEGLAKCSRDELTAEKSAMVKSTLKEIYPSLRRGAYYFTSNQDKEKALLFARSYIDLAMLKIMGDASLIGTEGYAELASFVAVGLYNHKDYLNAITYFQCYLSTSDQSNRKLAFEGLARCYYALKNYENVIYISTQGLKMFPDSWPMQVAAIESCVYAKEDAKMEGFLNNALKYHPDNLTLLLYRAQMYERTEQYTKAIADFERLVAAQSDNLDFSCHLAFDYYNAGVKLCLEDQEEKDSLRLALADLDSLALNTVALDSLGIDSVSLAAKRDSLLRDIAALNQDSSIVDADIAAIRQDSASAAVPRVSKRKLANQYFIKAAPLFETIIANTPYAANVAYALATCYVGLEDTPNLLKANKTLMALIADQVLDLSNLRVETNYKPTMDLNTKVKKTERQKATFSDVDINIPITGKRNEDTYVVVIGNEKYKYFSKVNFAQHDGKTFAEYCRKVLGVPSENIRERYDASLTEIKEPIKYLQEKTTMNPGKLDIIVYYAGHGIPNVATGGAYLLPTDATGTDFESCYELDVLYKQLNDMPAKSVTVFLDACFSGATRGNEMLFSERFVEYEVDEAEAQGNMVVFCATTGKQTAMAYDEKQHGFFTYFVLRKLKETGGNVTLGELGDYVTERVTNKAFDIKNKKQTPVVNVSTSLGDTWKTRKLY